MQIIKYPPPPPLNAELTVNTSSSPFVSYVVPIARLIQPLTIDVNRILVVRFVLAFSSNPSNTGGCNYVEGFVWVTGSPPAASFAVYGFNTSGMIAGAVNAAGDLELQVQASYAIAAPVNLYLEVTEVTLYAF